MKATILSAKGKSEDLELNSSDANPAELRYFEMRNTKLFSHILKPFRVLIPVNPRSLSTDLVTLRATSINYFSTSPRTFSRTSSSDSGGIYRKRNQRE